MRRRLISSLLAIFLISIPLVTLGAAEDFTVTYTPEQYIQFNKGIDTPGYPSPPSVANKFVGLLGTMTLTANTSLATLVHPAVLYSNGSTNFRFRGLRVGSGTKLKNFGFYIEIVTYLNAAVTPSYREPVTQNVVFLTNQDTVSNISSLKVEFYFVSWEDSSVFVPGELYELYQGVIGTFNLAVSSEGNIWNDTDYIPLVGQTIDPNTNEPTSPVPIVGGGSTSTLPNTVPYVNDEHPLQILQYLLSIINVNQIDLFRAYGSLKTKVADAQITLINGSPDDSYEVNISFNSSSVVSGRFNLSLDGNQDLYKIPYDLRFNETAVIPGDDIPWEDIHYINTSEIPIYITNIGQTTVDQAPAGTYSDTITVTIIPVDTI